MTRHAIGTAIDAQTARVSPAVRSELTVAGARGLHNRSEFLVVRVVTSAGVTGLGEVSAVPLTADGWTARPVDGPGLRVGQRPDIEAAAPLGLAGAAAPQPGNNH